MSCLRNSQQACAPAACLCQEALSVYDCLCPVNSCVLILADIKTCSCGRSKTHPAHPGDRRSSHWRSATAAHCMGCACRRTCPQGWPIWRWSRAPSWVKPAPCWSCPSSATWLLLKCCSCCAAALWLHVPRC